jgi:ATP/maltotriose-dependent transcriptional regulator MalT
MSFTGEHRFVLDYLSEEVLMQQPLIVQIFLLRTSILNRLSGPLCDAVTGQKGSQETLEMLEKANLGQRSTVLGWLNILPGPVIRAHPLLSIYYASLLLLSNQFEAAEIRLREAEAAMGAAIAAEQMRMIQGYVLTNRSTIAFFRGDFVRAIPFAHQRKGIYAFLWTREIPCRICYVVLRRVALLHSLLRPCWRPLGSNNQLTRRRVRIHWQRF